MPSKRLTKQVVGAKITWKRSKSGQTNEKNVQQNRRNSKKNDLNEPTTKKLLLVWHFGTEVLSYYFTIIAPLTVLLKKNVKFN